MSDGLNNMTLRQKLSEADKLVRELTHHLEHGFIPKAHVLRRTARQGSDSGDDPDVTDLTVRSTVETVMNSDKFTRQLTDRLSRFLAAIEGDVEKILGG